MRGKPVAQLVVLAILVGLLAACTAGIVKRDEARPAGSATPTLVETAVEPAERAATSGPSETSTFTPIPLPTRDLPTPTKTSRPTPSAPPPPVPPPTSAPPPPATASPTTSPLAILAFSVDVEDLDEGKRFRCSWETSGADEAMILIGTRQRFPAWWSVEPSGTFTFEQATTLFANPQVTLQVENAQGERVQESIPVAWPCQYDYFFGDCPEGQSVCYCPRDEPHFTWAAEQRFERGRLLWLQSMPYNDSTIENVILVLLDDGRARWFQDTWTPEQPESDPDLAPPEGLYQPVRGFGKLWRENQEVRDGLGWAIGPEQGFESAFQGQITENIPDVAYVRTADDQVVGLYGVLYMAAGTWSGSWRLVTP